MSGFLFLAVLGLQDARGLDAWQAGCYVLPMAAVPIANLPPAGDPTAACGNFPNSYPPVGLTWHRVDRPAKSSG
ncbi:hypothetical protein ACH4VM_37250 [Streptomyces sp. NPDC020792]|uniref:hypothetical protein n=1 Tax=Streptomyces sp. NPDC020792 TaxID=3365089 RepID=UPI0037BC029B